MPSSSDTPPPAVETAAPAAPRPSASDRRVSVLLPTYNRPGLLQQAIRSVLAQHWTDWELVVVNDGGQDVGPLISRFADPRIQYLDNPHGGKSAALNAALRASRGGLVAYLDDDDYYLPDHLAHLVEALENDPGAGAAYARTAAEYWVEDAAQGRHVLQSRRVEYEGPASAQSVRFANQTPTLGLMHRRNLLDEAGLFDPALAVYEDWDMWRRFSYLTRFVTLPGVSAVYRRMQGVTRLTAPACAGTAAAQERARGYLQTKLPGLTQVLRMRPATPDATPPGGKLSVLLFPARQGECCDRIVQALNGQTAGRNAFQVLVPEGCPVDPALARFDCRPLSAPLRPLSGLLAHCADRHPAGRLVLLRTDMVPGSRFVEQHLAAEPGQVAVGLTRRTVPPDAPLATRLIDPTVLPAAFALVYSGLDGTDFYYTAGPECLFNLSLPAEAIEAIARQPGRDEEEPGTELLPGLEGPFQYVHRPLAQAEWIDRASRRLLLERFDGYGFWLREWMRRRDGGTPPLLEKIARGEAAQPELRHKARGWLQTLWEAESRGEAQAALARRLQLDEPLLAPLLGGLYRHVCEGALLDAFLPRP